MSTRIPQHLKALPHGIDITAPSGIDALMAFHRRTFGDARMQAGESGSEGGDDQSGGKKPDGQPRTFSQDELNAILAEDRRKNAQKFADYEELKTKAKKLDQQEQENQTELQKAVARAEKAERTAAEEKANREKSDRLALAATVAQEKGVPTANISGSTREELEQSAEALIAWRGTQSDPDPKPEQRRVGGYNPLSGTGDQGPAPRSMLTGRERAEAKHAKNTN
jgi:flagellar biosynthesis GTPase FlhF